jgi:uncharacterized protein YkwD
MRTCLAVLLLTPAFALADSKPDEKKLELTDEEKGVLEQTNAQRKAAGLSELVPNAKLFQAARDHSANMAKQGRMSHVLDGRTHVERAAAAAGYPSGYLGENIAWNQRDATEVVECWMRSAGHRANILSRYYTEIGLGVAVNERGERYWTQVFGSGR